VLLSTCQYLGVPPRVTWAPDGVHVAFARPGRGIWVGDIGDLADASEIAASGEQLAWSPDGTKIAFVQTGHIWTVAPSGDTPTQLTFGDGFQYYPSWSPDGTTIAFLDTRGALSDQIFTVAADGHGLTQLTAGEDNHIPVWSPDGDKIAFTSARAPGVWMMDPDGSDQVRVIDRDMGEPIDWQAQGARLTGKDGTYVFGQSTTLSVQSPAGTAGTVTLYFATHGIRRVIGTKSLGPDAVWKVTVTPPAIGAYTASWLGDASRPLGGWSDVVSVKVRVNVEGRAVGGYATKNGVRLYHFSGSCASAHTGCPTVAFLVQPAHTGERVSFAMQAKIDGEWRAVGSHTYRLPDGSLVVHIVYQDRTIVGKVLRAKLSFGGDEDHLNGSSPWIMVSVTT
jgi:hypothetical protein